MASPNSTTSPESLPTESPDPDPSIFYQLISTKKMLGHQQSISSNPSTSLYTIEMHEPISAKKPSIILHAGDSKSGPVLGVVKLGSQRAKFVTIGIGSPDAILEEGQDRSERIFWERMQRLEKWGFRVYAFEFMGRLYMWRRTADRWRKQLKDMELRVGTEEDGELVGMWRGNSRVNIKRGSFFLKRTEDVDKAEAAKFEVAVLLTGLAIIEGYRRRAR